VAELVERVALKIIAADSEAVEDEIAPTSPRWAEVIARAALSEIFDWLEKPSAKTLDAGMDAADDALDSNYSSDIYGNRYDYSYLRSDAPSEIWKAMLAQMRKEAEV